MRLSPRMKLIVDSAQAEATRLQDEFVSTEHLFLALATEADARLPRSCCSGSASPRTRSTRR